MSDENSGERRRPKGCARRSRPASTERFRERSSLVFRSLVTEVVSDGEEVDTLTLLLLACSSHMAWLHYHSNSRLNAVHVNARLTGWLVGWLVGLEVLVGWLTVSLSHIIITETTMWNKVIFVLPTG
jgi:hypothetical protein